MCDQNNRSFFTGLIIGGIVGAGLVFLFGTGKGKKLRKEIEEKGNELLAELDNFLDKLEERGKELKKETEAVKEEIVEKAEEIRGKMGEEVIKKLDDTLANIEALQERGRQATAALRKKYFTRRGKSLG